MRTPFMVIYRHFYLAKGRNSIINQRFSRRQVATLNHMSQFMGEGIGNGVRIGIPRCPVDRSTQSRKSSEKNGQISL